MAGRIESIWIETLKRKASEILIRKIKTIISEIGVVELEKFFVFEYLENQLLLKFNFYDFAKKYSLIWKYDDPDSYQKMLDGGLNGGEYKKYFDSYEAWIETGELVFLIEHKLMMTLLFQRLGKCTVQHQLMSSRPLSKRRLTGPYSQLAGLFKKLDEPCLVEFSKKWVMRDSDLLTLPQEVVDLLFFLSTVNSVMELEKLDDVVRYIIDLNIKVRNLLQMDEMKMEKLLLDKNYLAYSAVSQLFRRVMLVYCRLFEMIGKEEWIDESGI